MIRYERFGPERIEEAYEIYEENGWTAYLGDREKLVRAFENSLYLLGAFEDDRLIGFVRCVGDEEYILYVQDLIVRPSHQRQGIGTELMRRISERYPSVRQFVLITDGGDEASNAFYEAIGMVRELGGSPVNHYFREMKK